MKKYEFGECLECQKPKKYETDIELCEKCMDLFDVKRLWEMHDNNELDALDFNESPQMRERFRANKGGINEVQGV